MKRIIWTLIFIQFPSLCMYYQVVLSDWSNMINKFWKITNIFKHIRMNLMVIGASGPKTGRILKNTSLAVQEALTHCLQNPQNGRWVWKEVQLQVIWSSDHLSQNEFFDSFIPSMRTSKIQISPSWPQNSFRVWKGVYISPGDNCPHLVYFLLSKLLA